MRNGFTPRASYTRPLWLRITAFITATMFAGMSVSAIAQITPAADGKGPHVATTPSGVPLVQINRPTPGGVSDNHYTQFSTSAAGAVLNNSPTSVQTQLAGWVPGNANLTTGAKVIVNQVTGSGPSMLGGPLEVAGRQATVVIANGNGITCAGCGFVNTNKAVLTTGTPILDASGNLSAYRVTGGTVSFTGPGMNASNVSQVDVLARAVQVNAALFANQLNVVTGANQVDANSLSTTPIAGTGATPVFGLDVSQIGGMYAQRITLAGSELGVGVNDSGTIAAQTGDLSLSTQGQLTVAGNLNAAGNLNLSARSGVTNSGAVYGLQSTTVNSVGDVSNSGVIAGQNQVYVNGRNVSSSGTLAAGVDASGQVGKSGDLIVVAGNHLAANGQNIAGGNAILQGAAVDLTGAKTAANGDLSVLATNGDVNLTGATTQAGQQANITAPSGTVRNDALSAAQIAQITAQQISINAAALSNRGSLIQQTGPNDTKIQIAGVFDNTDGTVTTNATDLVLHAGSIANAGGQVHLAGNGKLSVTTGVLGNQAGSIASNGALAINAASIDSSGGSLTSMGAGSITSTGALSNVNGTIESAKSLFVSAGSANNTGGLIQSDDASGLTVQVANQLTNAPATSGTTGGLIGGNGNAKINAGSIANSGKISSAQQLDVTTSQALNNSGTLAANGVTINASSIRNSGTISQTGATAAATIAATGAIDNGQGTVATNAANATITSASLSNDQGTVSHAGTGLLTIQAGTLSNNQGTIATNGDATITTAVATNSGTIGAQKTLQLTSSSLTNSGNVESVGSSSINAGTQLTNSGKILAGTSTTPAALSIAATQVDNSQGVLGAGSIKLDATNLTNHAGQIVQSDANGTATLNVANTLDNSSGGSIQIKSADLSLTPQTLNNVNGTIAHSGAGALTVQTGTLSNDSGVLSTNGSSTITATTVSNRAGRLSAVGSQSVTSTNDVDNSALAGKAGYIGGSSTSVTSTQGTVNNTGSLIEAATGATTVSGKTVTNDLGTIRALAASPVTVTAAGALSNKSGSIVGKQNVSVAGGSIDNSSGNVAALGNVTATSGSTFLNSSGLVEAQGDVKASASGAVSNVLGKIKSVGAGSTLTLSGSSIDNTNGVVTNAGTGATTLTADNTITNANPAGTASSGLIAGNGNVTLNAASLSNTQGGNVSATGDLTLNTPTSVVNDGGTLASGGTLTVNQPGASFSNVGGSVSAGHVAMTTATLDNTRGSISNAVGSTGNVAIQTGTLSNGSGAIGSAQDLRIVANSLVGDGKIVGGRDATVNLQGNYTYSAANQITANRNLTFSTTGTFTNAGKFSSAGNLTLNAANVVNQAGADIASGNAGDATTGATTINAAGGDITNAGRIEGNTVTTTSNTLENTGSMIGGTVTANANTLTNDGAAAIIAGTNGVNLWVPGTVNNVNGATIYSLGDVNIAANGATDANGNLVSQTGTVNNLSSTIEANGKLNIAANQINNVRQNIQTTTTTTTQTATLKPLPWLHTGWAGASAPFQDVNTKVQSAYYLNPTDIVSITPMVAPDGTLIQKVVVNMPANASAFQSWWGSYARPQSNGGTAWTDGQQQRLPTTTGQQTLYVQTVQNNQSNPDQAGGTAWPDHSLDTVANVYSKINYSNQFGDCTTNCVRLEVQSQYTDPNSYFLKDSGAPNLSGSNLVEAQRDATMTSKATTLAPGSGAPALLTSGGAMNLTIGSQLNNNNGTVAAGGNLNINGQATDGSNAKIANTSTKLSTTYSFSNRSGYGSVGGPQVPSTWANWTNPSITLDSGVAGGTITSNQATSINGGSITNTSVSAAGGVTGASAQSLGLGNVTLTGTAGNGAITGGQTVTTTNGATAATSTATAVSGAVRSVDGARSAVLNAVVPSNGLYKVQNSPGVNFFVQTDPRFTSYANFISSDYMLNLLGINPMQTQKRLGDGFYETQLIQQQVTQLTGRRYLPGYASDEQEYRQLMASGAAAAKQFNLEPGVALTDAQMAALTKNIVWLVNETVTLPDGSKQTALVPQVYLAKSDGATLAPTGALIAGDSVAIRGTDVTNNAATIAATHNAFVVADNDIQNLGGLISGNNVGLQAGRDIVNQSVTNTETANFGNSSSTHTSIGAVGQIQATDTAALSAGNQIKVQGAQVNVGGDLALLANKGINIGTVQTGSSTAARLDAQNSSTYTTTSQVGSTLKAGGDLSAISGSDIGVTGSNLTSGGNMTVAGAGNVNITNATNSTTDTRHGENSKGWNSFNLANQTSAGSNLTAGGSATVLAGAQTDASGLTVKTDGTAPVKNLTLQGSSIVAGNDGKGTGALTMGATGDVNIGASQDTTSFSSASHSTSNHIVSSTSTDTARNFTGSNAVGSLVSGDTINATAGHDLTIKGSDVAGTNDVTLSANHDVTIGTAQNTSQESDYFAQKKSGLMSGGGLSVSVGNSSQKTTSESSQVTNVGSTVGSVKGNLNITAGNNLHVTGSDLVAGQNITGKAANVTIDSATDTTHQSQKQETSKSGLTLGLSGAVGDALNNAVSESQAVRNSSNIDNGRAAALHGIAAAGDVATVAGGAATAAMGGRPNIGVQLSIGSSHSESNASENQAMQRGSSVTAGQAATFVATGDGTAGSGNVTVAGSNISANDVALMAKNQINLLNTTSTDSTRSSNSSSSASVGVSVGLTTGFGVSAAMQNAHGSGNADAAIQNNTHISAKNSATIVSGGDTNIIGANVNANKVTANVGGNLNVASVQDTTTSTAHQSSTGGGLSISQGGVGGSFNAQHGSANGNYAGVNEQAGIQAGSGGFNVNVAGNTDLKGAYIASTADASKNSLTTGTLTTSDIQNHSKYNADSSGFSAGASVGMSQKSVGPASVSGAGGVTPMVFQSESGDESATTRSGISPGAITVTKPAEQTQDVAAINRDTSNLNGKVANVPDLQKTLSQQSDTMNAAQAAGQTVSQAIGSYADAKRDQALTKFDADIKAGNLDAAKADLEQAQSWLEGGSNRVALQIGGGALIGGLGGSNALTGALGGAAGAGLSAALAGQTQKISDAVGGASGSQLIGNIAGNVLSGLGGALVGGSAGAATASNVNLYNQNNDDGDKNAQMRIGLGRKVLNILSGVAGQIGAGGGNLGEEMPKIPGTTLASGMAGAAESKTSPFTDKYLSGSGGRWGNAATRQLNFDVAQALKNQGYAIEAGGGIASEEYIGGGGPGTKGGTYVDITAKPANGIGPKIRVQTITTQADGVTPTPSEAAAAARIQLSFPSDKLILIPKGATAAQIDQAIKKGIGP